jgi:hypothetical protein
MGWKTGWKVRAAMSVSISARLRRTCSSAARVGPMSDAAMTESSRAVAARWDMLSAASGDRVPMAT